MKTLLTLILSISCFSVLAARPQESVWGKDYYRSLPQSVMAKARDLHRSCKSFHNPSLVRTCLGTEIKNVRLEQVRALDRIRIPSSCMHGEQARILGRMNWFYLPTLPGNPLSIGTEVQLVEQLLNDINYLQGIEQSLATGEPLLCG